MSSIKAVFFDFGGTLFSYLDLRPANTELIGRLARRLGSHQRDITALGAAYREASGFAFDAFADLPYYLHRDVFCAAFDRFAHTIGCQTDEHFLDWAYVEMRRMMVESFVLREDCNETLSALKREGLYLSVVSNIDDDFLDPMIERCGLAALLDDWSSSQEARSCKPDPGCFELALRKAGRRPEEVLFVGDSLLHDVGGAQRLGMPTVLILDEGFEPPGQGLAQGRADHEIRSLSELVPIVRGTCPGQRMVRVG